MKNITCHIGFPKTGTTLLQKKIYPELNGLTYIDNPAIKDIFYDIIEKDDSILDWQLLESNFQKSIAEAGDNILFSYEPLTGHHYRTEFPNRTQIANRLKKLGTNQIIITIRNQVDALESSYNQYIKAGGILKAPDYFNFSKDKKPYFTIQYFDYFKIVKLYATIFGQENISVLQHENLKENGDHYFKKLLDFLKITDQDVTSELKEQVNQSISTNSTNLLRYINHFTYNHFTPSHPISEKISTDLFHRLLKKLPKSKNNKKRNVAKYEDQINDFFAASNFNLEKEFGIVLHKKYFKKNN